MLLSCVRVGLFLAALVASLSVAAEPRRWTLTGVRFENAIATGYFNFLYDDVSWESSDWNVHVTDGPDFPALTYHPGNSTVYARFTYDPGSDAYVLRYVAFDANEPIQNGLRSLMLKPLFTLDGSRTTVPLVVAPQVSPSDE